ncbi:MAG TPA: hydantoinase/oxoprolinase family protein [Methanomassiliicoccales archaeon]|jgi:N-methylhydantoinase A/oxoprolinase/acetone carboxylase beta subunit
MNLGLGIDTGGTFTDAAAVDLDTMKIVAQAKAPTSYENLSIGILAAMDRVIASPGIAIDDIKMIGLSTTLATNSLLQGKGGEVGLIGIGWKPEPEWNLGCKHSRFIKGGADSIGRIAEAMDMGELGLAIDEVSEGVDAIVVSGLFSVCNGMQEMAARDEVLRKTGLPVIMGQSLTMDLGIHERSVTAILNAKLLPVINGFLDSMEMSIRSRRIDARIFVFKGDGGLMGMENARERPVEMVLSGPAASLMGGKALANVSNCMVVDMGGTSTDIAVLDEGFPRLNNEGAVVGNYRTRVKGIDIWTCGLGGDSVILADNRGDVTIGPERVVPLALASVMYPLLSVKVVQENELNLYLPNTSTLPEALSPKERQTLEFVMGNAPCTLYEAMKGCPDIPVVEYVLDALRARGLVIRTGLTPTDLLHFAGRYQVGDAQASRAGVVQMAGRMFMTPEELAPLLLDLVVTRVGEEIIKKGLIDEGGEIPKGKGFGMLLRSSAGHGNLGGIAFRARPDRTIVGIGAPASQFIKPLEERMDCTVIIPEGHEVGNAVGAVCSLVTESVTVQVFLRDDKYLVFAPLSSPMQYSHLGEALNSARASAEHYVKEKISTPSVEDVRVRVETFEKRFSDGYGQESKFVNWVDVRATATAKPKLRM